MKKTVTYVKDRYNNTPMFITENGKQTNTLKLNHFHWTSTIISLWRTLSECFVGYGTLYDPNNTKEENLIDFKRVNYMSGHLDNLGASIR